MSLVVWIVVGAIAGTIASLITNAQNGLIMNAILGIIGGVVGSWLLDFFGYSIGSGLIAEIIVAAVGAVVVIGVARLFA